MRTAFPQPAPGQGPSPGPIKDFPRITEPLAARWFSKVLPPPAIAANAAFIDRTEQKNTSFTGIKGINTQDVALQEGMGAITDRTEEHLGTSDRAIAVMRRLLLEAVSAVARGESPRGHDAATYRGIRPHDGLIPVGSDWREAFATDLKAKW